MTSEVGNTSIPQLVAHRGWPARYPENSLAGLVAAVDVGAQYLEFDVQLSGDGVPLAIHDDNLSRTTGVDLSVTQTRAAIIRSVASDTAPVSTVAEICEWLSGQAVTAFVEVKRRSLATLGAATVMDRLLPALRPALDRCVLISFAAEALEHARRRLGAPVGWVLDGLGRSHQVRARHLAPDYLFVSRRRLGARDPWPGDWRWAVYTVDEPETAVALARRGVGLVETDDIGAMLAAPPWRTAGAPGC